MTTLTNEERTLDWRTSESSAYLKEISTIPVLSDEEFDTLIVAAKNGDKDAYDKIVTHNLRLVVSVVKCFMNVDSSLSFMDLVMEGNIGLYEAIERFEPNKGYKFSTYAWQWIRQSVSSSLFNKGQTIRYPHHINGFLIQYRNYIHDWQQVNASEDLPPKEDVMKHIPALTDATYKTMMAAYRTTNIDSINRPASNEIDDSDELLNFIPDKMINLSEELEHNELAKELDEIIERYVTNHTYTPDRTRDIIYRRFGFGGYQAHTLADIGKHYGITREAVRRVEEKFLKFCRTGHNYSVLQGYR